jgi:hypothetical protein
MIARGYVVAATDYLASARRAPTYMIGVRGRAVLDVVRPSVPGPAPAALWSGPFAGRACRALP